MLTMVFACECDECGHVWLSECNTAYPEQCAKCRTHNWNSIGRRRRLDKILAEHAAFITGLPDSTDFSDYRSNTELAAICHAAVNAALKVAIIVKPMECSKCLQAKRSYQLMAHHRDYSKPLEIKWLCCSCHRVGHNSEINKPSSRELQYVPD